MVKTNKKIDKREAHIKKKLTAAIMMLLISCIMTVTSTYAWFTLSTAPEITGVSTTVGANGSLEIALARPDLAANEDNWEEGPNASGQSDSGINETWGNLVDLSTGYGLDEIILYPSELNIASVTHDNADTPANEYAATVSSTSILKTPEYGVDGRVSSLDANTSTGIYDTVGASFVKADGLHGVRAIGTVAGMTDRQMHYRNATGAIRTNMQTTINTVRSSWAQKGTSLALLALKYNVDKDKTQVTEGEYANLVALVNDLEAALEYIDSGIINALDAYLASKLSTYENDGIYNGIHSALATLTVKENISVAADGKTITITKADKDKTHLHSFENADFAEIITDFKDMWTNVSTTKANLNAAQKVEGQNYYAWTGTTGVGTAFNALVKPDNVHINDYTPAQFLALDQFAQAKIVFTDGVKIQLLPGSGIYYDIASYVGNISGYVQIPAGSSILGITITESMNIQLETKHPTTTPVVLETMYQAVKDKSPDDNGATGTTVKLTDKYGYVIDFFIRTNAANSNLLLSDAVNRVTTEANSEATMGNGSGMTFTSSRTMLAEDVKDLMKAIRVVFVDADYNVISYAGLDETTYSSDGVNHTMKLRLYEMKSVDGTETLVKKTTGEGASATDDLEIMPLNQNATHKLSAIVYLDGNLVDNSDVATDGFSLDGSLNLQFASDANLKAMNYTGFEVPAED